MKFQIAIHHLSAVFIHLSLRYYASMPENRYFDEIRSKLNGQFFFKSPWVCMILKERDSTRKRALLAILSGQQQQKNIT